MKNSLKLFSIITALLCIISITYAQSSKKKKQAAKAADVEKMVNNMSYVFKANYAEPQRGGQKVLTSDYDLRIVKDTITAFLPYYGRAYTAPNELYPTDGGIKFTSTKFNYKIVKKKNGSWLVSIKPKDTNTNDWRDIQQLTLNISTEGYASLQVVSTNRDPISFEGYVEAVKNGD